MASRPSNDILLHRLKNGNAEFELVPSPVLSIFTMKPFSSIENSTRPFLAKILPFFPGFGPPLGSDSPVLKKLEHYSVKKINGDGRCLFRALVRGMASNKGIFLSPREETDDADELRMAIKEVICENEKERHQYPEALVAITAEEPLKRYCQRIQRSDFWGGESELLVLSKLCHQPIIVYIPKHEPRDLGFIPIAEYGVEFLKGSKKSVKLLHSGNHYDLLV